MTVDRRITKLEKEIQRLNTLVLGARRASAGGADHNLLSATHLDTVAANVIAGDIIRGNNTPAWERHAAGNNGDVLTLAAGLPTWSPPVTGGGAVFDDQFEDADLYWAWTTYNTAAGKTIVEAGGVLTITVTAGTNGRWDSSYFYAPSIHIGVIGFPAVIECKLNSFTVNDDVMAGLFMHNRTGSNLTYLFGRYRDDGAGINGLVAERLGTILASNGETTLPIWLRIRTGGNSRLRSTQYFDYSTDGSSWTNLTNDSNSGYYPSTYWTTFGLFAKTISTSVNGIAAPFEYFTMTIDPGPG